MSKERRLGRGLEVLLGRAPGRIDPRGATEATAPSPAAAPAESPGSADYSQDKPQAAGDGVSEPWAAASAMPIVRFDAPHAHVPPPMGPVAGLQRIDVDLIDSNPAQPRQDFDPVEMQALAESLKSHGLLQPVVVRRMGDRYQVIAGERRLRAAMQAGWTEVPVNIVEADDRETAELAIIENLQRKDLNPLEKAASFQRYLQQYACKQEELAARLNLDRSTIANFIRLLELPEPVQEAIRQGKLTQGHARALLPLGDEREQVDFCQRIQREGLSVRQTEALVQEMIAAADEEGLGLIDREGKKSRATHASHGHLAALEQEFRAALGLKVQLTHNARGRGKLVIHFRNHEEFERLRQQINDTTRPDTRGQVG